MPGKFDFNDAHTNWVSACRKLCLTTCLLTSTVQVMEASGIVADLLMTMHSSVLHPIGNGNSAPPELMIVFSRLGLSFAVWTQEQWAGKCTCHSQDSHWPCRCQDQQHTLLHHHNKSGHCANAITVANSLCRSKLGYIQLICIAIT